MPRRAPDPRSFWDAAARENAAFYIATGFTSECEEFFSLGRRETDEFLAFCEVEIGATDRILEIGSGVGRMTRRLAELGAEVLATDVSPVMLERLADNLGDLDNVHPMLVPGDGHLPGVGEATVDVVFSYIVLQHVPTAQAQLTYLESSIRALRPGGKLAVQVRGMSPVARALDVAGPVVHRLRGRDTLRREYRGARIRRADVERIADERGAALEIRRNNARHDWIVARRFLA